MISLVLDLELVPSQLGDDLSQLASHRWACPLVLRKILKKSIDARKKEKVVVKIRAVFDVSGKDRDRLLKKGAVLWHPETEELPLPASVRPQVVIVGTGPAGLFCALRLARRGILATVLEQGKAVEDRHVDVQALRTSGSLDPDSNVVFGEGGAGTYSDGKLTTRIHKPGISWVFDRLVEHGASESILFDAKPHVGTDVLSRVVASIRRELRSRGASVVFGAKVVHFEIDRGRVVGVSTADGRQWRADAVVLATGHSARGIYERLATGGIDGRALVDLEPKALAVGVRIEHPASFINQAQYGEAARLLPTADYRLTWNNGVTGRGTYSFCMCPGGEVVNSSSEVGRLCVNGMSYSPRDLPWSNAALVTSVGPADFGPELLGGLGFQRRLEESAFQASGGGGRAPAVSAKDFLGRSEPGLIRPTSYLPGVTPADFRSILPDFLTAELEAALGYWNRRIPGFVDQGTLIGVETRTSSPVRILRGADFQAPRLKGLFPAGEGAGYAGGIISAAVDGVRIADFLSGDTKSPSADHRSSFAGAEDD